MTKKQKTAVALSYKPGNSTAPKLVAKGKGVFADKILEIAREYNIEICEEKKLVEDLFHLDIEREIPIELYDAVAAVLAFVYNKQTAMKIK
ncbi:MAG: flagellar biosynthesis protein FlhB [Calditrichaeota bacterium]|nr:MAG: flagellar biosynthesis protein FlhB [Calditrichota bacterium]